MFKYYYGNLIILLIYYKNILKKTFYGNIQNNDY